MTFRVVLDANVIYPTILNEILLSLADAETFSPLWSDEILDEAARNLKKNPKFDDIKIEFRMQQMRNAFPSANISSNINLIESITCTHIKDRHVLSTAIMGNAGALVTHNIKDFPSDLFNLHQVELIHPDDFLADQFDINPPVCAKRIAEMLKRWENPTHNVDSFAKLIQNSLPEFSAVLLMNKDAINFLLHRIEWVG